jgi:hypothetical protein
MPELLKREGASKSGEPSSRGLMSQRMLPEYGVHREAARYTVAYHDGDRYDYRRTDHERNTRFEPDELVPRAV